MSRALSLFLGVALLAVTIPSGAASWSCETDASMEETDSSDYRPLQLVSILSLITRPEDFDGKRVDVGGVFRLYYDRIALYASREHLEADDYASSIDVDLPRCLNVDDFDRMASLNGTFVSVRGVFSSQGANFRAGSIHQVELVRGPAED